MSEEEKTVHFNVDQPPRIPPPIYTNGNKEIGDTRNIIDNITKTNLPKKIKDGFWHFTSQVISSTFADENDLIINRMLFWASVEMEFKTKKAQEIDSENLKDKLQTYLHSQARLKQSKGGMNKNNLINALLKSHTIQEITTKEDIPKGKKRFF